MRILLFLLLFALGLAGCATGPHRFSKGGDNGCTPTPPTGTDDEGKLWEGSDKGCGQSWAVRHTGAGQHGVNYVEIDEQGVLRNRAAAEDALRYAQEPGAGGKPVYMVVFIHGWHHDADADDDNVQAFHRALASVSRWHPDRDVRGIYIGWRGKAWSWPWIKYLTFWDRKSTSEEVGRGGLLEFLLRLERAVKNGPSEQGPKTAKGPKQANRLVLVGHSFGASVAFNALSHLFLERFLDGVYTTGPASPRFRGYGDLVVLVNPAIEAMRYMPFQSALKYYTSAEAPLRADFSQETVPRLVVLSSEGDWATHYAFPAARFFSTVFESHDPVSPLRSPDANGGYSETAMDSATLGNYEPFYSHAALRFDVEAVGAAAAQARESKRPLDKCDPLNGRVVRNLLSGETSGDPKHGRRFPDSLLRLDPKPGLPFTPYLLAAADRSIIADHTAIGQPNLICWINQLADTQ
jgi:pimeloyl-ACP methyl ester carboxylesterase